MFVSRKRLAVTAPTEGELPFKKPPPTEPPMANAGCASTDKLIDTKRVIRRIYFVGKEVIFN